MRTAAERTGAHGLAIVALRNSGHLGRIGACAEILAGRGLISLHFVNSSGFGILTAPDFVFEARPTTDPDAFYADPPGASWVQGGGPHHILRIIGRFVDGRVRQQPLDREAARQQHAHHRDRSASFAGREFFAAELERLAAWAAAVARTRRACCPANVPRDSHHPWRRRRRMSR
jgi:hypothetical protein